MNRKCFLMAAFAIAFGVLAPSGANAQDAVFVTPSGKVGVGTSTPTEKFHVFENLDVNSILVIENPNLGTSAVSALRAKADTALVSLVAHGSGRTLSRFGQTLAGWTELLMASGNGIAYGTLTAKPLIFGTNNVNRLQITATGSIGVNTSAPASLFHVSGGDIRVSGGSFIDDGVTLNAPDYVFEPDYALTPLPELKEFIARERHLPNIPSAAEIKENGLKLGQFQMLLLEKVEELTLHTIAQQEEIQGLRARNAELETRLEKGQGFDADLRSRVAALEQALGLAASESPR